MAASAGCPSTMSMSSTPSTGSTASALSSPPSQEQSHASKPNHLTRWACDVRRRFQLGAFVRSHVGAEVARRYRVETALEVGAGGYGKVIIAEDREVDSRRVAIKEMVSSRQSVRRSFEREAELMKRLDHPNICRILETYEKGSVMCVVMEYCAGGTLFDRIREQGKIDEAMAKSVVKQVAGALKHAHGHGIAHRDLKPENVCFCEERSLREQRGDSVKVIDWGVGAHFGSSDEMFGSVGSQAYAAPEVLLSDDTSGYTAACDLWSLGVMTYVMISGKPPFWGPLEKQIKRMSKERYPMDDEFWQTAVSSESKDLIRRLLRADPTQRLSVDGVLAHPWLSANAAATKMEGAVVQKVLSNVRSYSKSSDLHSLCAAAVAKELDFRSLQDVHGVFNDMDSNGDGVLEPSEVREGFAKLFGASSAELRDIEEVFSRVDLDGSGTISYTEFCAAGVGVADASSCPERALRAAFKAFDADNDGRITAEELREVAGSSPGGACEELFRRFDADRDGALDFGEWLRLLRASAASSDEEENPVYEDDEANPTCEGDRFGRGCGAAAAVAAASCLAVPPGTTLLDRRRRHGVKNAILGPPMGRPAGLARQLE